jgi:hypothetical protein
LFRGVHKSISYRKISTLKYIGFMINKANKFLLTGITQYRPFLNATLNNKSFWAFSSSLIGVNTETFSLIWIQESIILDFKVRIYYAFWIKYFFIHIKIKQAVGVLVPHSCMEIKFVIRNICKVVHVLIRQSEIATHCIYYFSITFKFIIPLLY